MILTAIAAAPFTWLAWALYRLLADATVRGIRNHRTTSEGES